MTKDGTSTTAEGWFITTVYAGKVRMFRADLVVALEQQENLTQVVLSKAGGQLHTLFSGETPALLAERIQQALERMAFCGMTAGPLIDTVFASFDRLAGEAARRAVEEAVPEAVTRQLMSLERGLDDAPPAADAGVGKRKGGK